MFLLISATPVKSLGLAPFVNVLAIPLLLFYIEKLSQMTRNPEFKERTQIHLRVDSFYFLFLRYTCSSLMNLEDLLNPKVQKWL